MRRLKIRNSFYYSIGRRYNWMKDGFDEVGLGIAKPYLKDNKTLLVNVDGKDYFLDCVKAVEFINSYKSFEDIKGVRLGYISKSLLRKLG